MISSAVGSVLEYPTTVMPIVRARLLIVILVSLLSDT